MKDWLASGEILQRALGGAYAAGLMAGAAFLYWVGDADALFAAARRPATLVISNCAGLLLLCAAGLATAAAPLFILLATPRIFRRRPRPPWARVLVGMVFCGFATLSVGVGFGGWLQTAYLGALGYRPCGAAKAGTSPYLEYQTWAGARQACP